MEITLVSEINKLKGGYFGFFEAWNVYAHSYESKAIFLGFYPDEAQIEAEKQGLTAQYRTFKEWSGFLTLEELKVKLYDHPQCAEIIEHYRKQIEQLI